MAFCRDSIIAGTIFGLDTAYAAWFWRSPRPQWAWALLSASVLSTFIVFWWLLRRRNFDLAQAGILYDVVAVCLWYFPLLIWKEEVASSGQHAGIVLTIIGALLIAFA